MLSQPVNCCAVILAAGRSERMGTLKQLLQYAGKTLLQRAIDAAKGSNAGAVMVVLGYEADRILTEVDTSGVIVVRNDAWSSGMASSITAAMNAIEQQLPETDAVILMVCDQPFLDSALLNQLITKQQETGKPVIACEYGGTMGVPVLFHRDFFDELRQLHGDNGAKKLIGQNPDTVAKVPFPFGIIDIDTPAAYRDLTRNVI